MVGVRLEGGGVGVTKRIKNVVNLKYFMVSKFSRSRKNTSYTRSQTFHEVCVQGKGVYIDRSTYAYILSIPMGNENLLPSQSLRISRYFLDFEVPLTITKIVPFSIMFDHCESEIIRIRIRAHFFLKEESLAFKAFNLFEIQ